MIETVFGETGRIDLLVNNAGFGISGAAEESSIGQAKWIFLKCLSQNSRCAVEPAAETDGDREFCEAL